MRAGPSAGPSAASGLHCARRTARSRKDDNRFGSSGTSVRPGLVAVGAVLVVVGAAVFVGVLDPGNTPVVERTDPGFVVDLTGGNWRTILLPTTADGHATLTLTWSASALANVSLYQDQNCRAPPCNGPALRYWVGNVSGHWSATGSVGSMYLLWVYAAVNRTVSLNFSATLTEQYRTGQLTLPLLPFAVTMVGASLLAGIGGVGLYLGLFLPAAVYGPFDRPREGDEPGGTGGAEDASRPYRPE